MPIYKRCSRCGRRLRTGTICECQMKAKRQQKRERDKAYDEEKRDKNRARFYKTKAWLITKEEALIRCMYIDIYEYYKFGRIAQAQMVHHIAPVSEEYSRRLDMDNLIGLTNKNHARIHQSMKERGEKEIQTMLYAYLEKWNRKENSDVQGAVKLF